VCRVFRPRISSTNSPEPGSAPEVSSRRRFSIALSAASNFSRRICGSNSNNASCTHRFHNLSSIEFVLCMISPSLWEAAFEAWSEFSKRDQNATGVRLRVRQDQLAKRLMNNFNGRNQRREQTASKAGCRAMRATAVESHDSRVPGVDLLRCQIVLSAEIESQPSQQST